MVLKKTQRLAVNLSLRLCDKSVLVLRVSLYDLTTMDTL